MECTLLMYRLPFGEWDVVDFVYRFYVGLPQLRARHSLGMQHTLPEYALKLNANLTKEQQKYGDIIFHPHTDNKYYLTSKRLGAILWAVRQGIVDSFDMYIQSDSDSYLSFRKWYHDIRTDLGTDVNLHDLVTNQYFLYGRLNSHPMRGRFKFTDFDKQAVIHPYGHAFVLSAPLVQLIAQHSQYCRTDLQYPLDDVSVGIWVFAVTGLSGYVTNHTVALNEGKGLYDTNNQRFSFSQLTNDLVMVHHVRARNKFELLCNAMRQRDEKIVLSAFDS